MGTNNTPDELKTVCKVVAGLLITFVVVVLLSETGAINATAQLITGTVHLVIGTLRNAITTIIESIA